MHISNFLVLFTTFLLPVLADVALTAPKAGLSFTASDGSVLVDIAWDDDAETGDQFSLDGDDIKYTISLCTGNNNMIQCYDSFVKGQAISNNKYTAEIKTDDAIDGFYFFQIYVLFAPQVFTIHYTNRFELDGFSGSKVTQVLGGSIVTLVATATDSPPPAVANGGNTAVDTRSFTIPFSMQTGKSKYAPMQLQPGSKVTATAWTMQYPTSAVTYFSTIAGEPNARSTFTPGWSYTPESAPNYATPAPYPNTFYPASDRVSKASLSSAARKKRWL